MEIDAQAAGRVKPANRRINLIEAVDLAGNLAEESINRLGRLVMVKEIIPLALLSTQVPTNSVTRVISEVRSRLIIQADGVVPGKVSLKGLRQQYYPGYGIKSISAIVGLMVTYDDLNLVSAAGRRIWEEANFWERLVDTTKNRLTVRPNISDLILTPQKKGMGRKNWTTRDQDDPASISKCDQNWAADLPTIKRVVPDPDWDDESDGSLDDFNREFWETAIEYQLFPKIIKEGYLTEEDIRLLQAHFAGNEVLIKPHDERFDRLSIAVANLA